METPKSPLTRRVELFANVVIVFCGLLFAVRYFMPGLFAGNTAPVTIAAGAKLGLPAVDWSAHDTTVVLAVREGCHYCAESAPFYQRLTKALGQSGKVHLVTVLPGEPAQSEKYLAGMGIPAGDIRQADLASLKVPYTPTLLVLDRSGVVKDVFVGKLSAEKEAQVLSRLALAQ